MLPMVVAGGLLIALSLCFGLNAAEQAGSLPAILKQIGAAAFTSWYPCCRVILHIRLQIALVLHQV